MSTPNPSNTDEKEKENNGLVGVSGGPSIYTIHGDKKLAFQQLHPNIKEQLKVNTWEIVRYSPLKFIITHNEFKQIVHASVEKVRVTSDSCNDTGDHETIPCLKFHNIIMDAIPIEITVHENPLSLLEHKYTIKFSTCTW